MFQDLVKDYRTKYEKTKVEVLNELLKYIPMKPKQQPALLIKKGDKPPPQKPLPPQPLDAIFKEIVKDNKVDLDRVETKFRDSKLNNKKYLEEIKT